MAEDNKQNEDLRKNISPRLFSLKNIRQQKYVYSALGKKSLLINLDSEKSVIVRRAVLVVAEER